MYPIRMLKWGEAIWWWISGVYVAVLLLLFPEIPIGGSNIIFFFIYVSSYTSHGGSLRGLQTEINFPWVLGKRWAFNLYLCHIVKY